MSDDSIVTEIEGLEKRFTAIAYNIRWPNSGPNDAGDFSTLEDAKKWSRKILKSIGLSSTAYITIRDQNTRAIFNVQVHRGRLKTTRFAFR